MVLKFFRSGRSDNLEHIQNKLIEMLAHDRHSFDSAIAALLSGADAEAVGPELRATDDKVNELEREIRRELVVHATVHGAGDVAAILVYMSIVKDAERIGDYAKNIFDLAASGVDFSKADDRPLMVKFSSRASEMITESGSAFADEDQDRAHALIAEADGMLDTFDKLVDSLVVADGIAREAVPRALFYRHLKRITAHLMNLLSAVIVPVDRLDYSDEPDV